MAKANLKKKLEKECDHLAREICLVTHDHKCLKPGCKVTGTIVLHAHHVFTRSLWHIRWDQRNLIPLHPGCHIFWAHKRPDLVYELVEKRLGLVAYKKLVILKNTGIFKRSIANLEDMKAKLELELKNCV